MPYLKFEFSVKIDDDKIEKLLNFTKNKFSEIMSKFKLQNFKSCSIFNL